MTIHIATIKVLNGKRKKPFTRQMHQLKRKFASIKDMKCSVDVKSVDVKLGDDLDDGNDFDIGYYEGRHATKRWLLDDTDLKHMYEKYQSGEVHLWCDILRNDDIEPPPSKKRKEEVSGTRCQDKEEKVDSVFTELYENHKDSYSSCKLNFGHE